MRVPYSSYLYDIDGEYRRKVTAAFWREQTYIEGVEEAPIYTPLIDSAKFDIDGDGIEEECVLRAGPTSGLFTFIVSASEDGELEYFNTFHSVACGLCFEKNEKGQTMLVGRHGDYTRYMMLSVEDGNIVIASDEQDIAYWGEQGIDSPYAWWDS